MRPIGFQIRLLSVMAFVTIFSASAVAGGGAAVFEAKCRSCHRSISVFSEIEPALLRSELAQPTRRPHRFSLTSEEQEALVEYLLATPAPANR